MFLWKHLVEIRKETEIVFDFNQTTVYIRLGEKICNTTMNIKYW